MDDPGTRSVFGLPDPDADDNGTNTGDGTNGGTTGGTTGDPSTGGNAIDDLGDGSIV